MTWYAWVMVVVLGLATLCAALYASSADARRERMVRYACVCGIVSALLLIGVLVLAERGDC